MNGLSLAELFSDENQALEFAYNYDFLYDGGMCQSTTNCPGHYEIVSDSSTKFGYRLICDTCEKTKSLLFCSIFSRCHIPLNKVFHIIYLWANEYSVTLAAHEAGVTEATVTNFYQA